ncbi:MAG: hypothetical protein ACRDT0_22825 [Pseudonocardiaceae bacterium]
MRTAIYPKTAARHHLLDQHQHQHLVQTFHPSSRAETFVRLLRAT